MSTALRTTLAAAGAIVALLATPAIAEMSLAEQQRVARILADQGYSGVRFLELDRDVTVLGYRDGSVQAFAYNNGHGGLVPVGMDASPAGDVLVDRNSDSFVGDSFGISDNPFARGQIWGGGGISDR